MPRYKLILEYDGRPFVGWQRQDDALSVQGAVEEAIFRFCGERVTLHGAGRTDAGVHALGQVAHFDLAAERETQTIMDALNFHLKPHPAAVLAAQEVPEDFHARFSARVRSYRYRIINRRAPLTLDFGRAWAVSIPLDAAAMHEAAQGLVGHHDFTSFRASLCQAKSPVKTLMRLSVERQGEEIRMEAQAPSFLHNQIRIIIGTLKLVGEGKWTKADVARALAARDRAAAGPTAPPEGLYFTRVDYDGGDGAANYEPAGKKPSST